MAPRRAAAVAAPSRFSGDVILRFLRVILIAGVVLLGVLVAVGGFLTYEVIGARNDTEAVSPSSFLMTNYENFSFSDPVGGRHDGWLLPGLRGAPVIILCHGYNSNRSDLLALGTYLRENHFNVYLFNFEGTKTRKPFWDLGVSQVSAVQAAVQSVSQQAGINPKRVGLYGTSTGGYAALLAAERNPLVKTIVVDNIYEKPVQMFDIQVNRMLSGSGPAFRLITEAEFGLLTLGSDTPRLRENLPKLSSVPKLFICGRDTPALAAVTEQLYRSASGPKHLLVLEESQAGLASGAEKQEYQNQVLDFFLENLHLRAD